MRQWLTLLAAAALVPICAHAAELPDFGSPADAALSKSREAQIGRGVMLQLRNAGVIVDDPFLEEYVSTIGSRLAGTPVRKQAYDCVSCLNRRHQNWAWCSLFSVGFSDLYVRMCSMGVWTDWRIL